MRYTFLSVLATVFVALSTWKYEKTENDTINPQFQRQSQENNKEWEKVPTTLVEQKKEQEKLTVRLTPLLIKKNSTKRNLNDRLFFKPAFTAFSLDTVFFILVIHTFGADLVASISTVFGHMSSSIGLVDLALTFTVAVYANYKWKREKLEMVNENTELQKGSLNKEKEREDVVTTLMELKTELENQRGRLKELLEKVEREREVNKQKLQAVETEITEREMTFDKPEELLREKEDLLRVQWKLDQTKKDNERQLLNTERLLEPIEIQFTRIHRMKEVDMQL